jgi:membrane protein YqaA with SNARE-associated domain
MKRLRDLLVGLGPGGIFLVAIIDGMGVPLPGGVDSLLVLLAAANPAQAYFIATVTLVGSIIGGMFLYYVARKGGEAYLDRYTSDGRGLRLREWFLEYGLLTVFIPALIIVPLPLKVAVVCSGALGVKPGPFLLTLLAARIPRFYGLAYLGAHLGEESGAWLKSHAWHMASIAVALFAMLYLLILIVQRRRGVAR